MALPRDAPRREAASSRVVPEMLGIGIGMMTRAGRSDEGISHADAARNLLLPVEVIFGKGTIT